MHKGWLVLGLACAVALGAGSALQAASIVVLQKGDGQDQILTIAHENGSADASITLICEAPRLEFGLAIQAPVPVGRDGRIRIRVDGAGLSLGCPGVTGPQTIFLLKGPSGRKAMQRLTQARLVEVDLGAGPLRFRPQDGAGTVAQFREVCGI